MKDDGTPDRGNVAFKAGGLDGVLMKAKKMAVSMSYIVKLDLGVGKKARGDQW